MSKNAFALDLRTARKKSGLTQTDCAHLLGTFQSTVSDLEAGKRLPGLPEICTLSLIYGRTFESLYEELFSNARRALRSRLKSLSACAGNWIGRFNREYTIDRLVKRLEEFEAQDHEDAA